MYQWTHIELSRQQSNGPKKEHIHSTQQCDQRMNKCENDSSTILLTSNGHGESFASMKNKLFSHELADVLTKSEDIAQQNNIESVNSEHEENVQKKNYDEDHQLENGQIKKHNCIDCDNSLRKVFVETTTQTEDILASTVEEKKPCESSSLIPSPPPPPPMPLFLVNLNKTTNEKIIASDTSSDHTITAQASNQSIIQNAQPATILSSASSFCAPPPPPMNGIPGPPPLPLPTGNMWFKSDSK